MCPYCKQDTGGNHAWDCPMNPVNMNNQEFQQVKFKEYLSTGLTPEQIELLKTENELLKIRLQQFVDEEYIISFTN